MAGVQEEITVRSNTSVNSVLHPTTPTHFAHLTQKLSTDKIDTSTTKPLPPNKTTIQNLIQKVTNANVVTPIKVETFKKWLLGFPKKELQFLLDGFTYGFKIPFQGERKYRIYENFISVKQNMKTLTDKITNEVLAGRVAGPFQSPPFTNIQISPLGLVPKYCSGEFRIIHHLSYPKESSINDGIPQTLSTVNYQTIDDAINLINFYGKKCLLAKTDIGHSFKLIPVHPSDHELLGFSIENKFYYDKTLPMGLSYSCNLLERFSSAVHWIVEQKMNALGCVHVLDDFLFVGPSFSLTTPKKCIHMSEDIGIPIKFDKTVYPTTTLTFFQLEINTTRRQTDKIKGKVDIF